MCIVLFLLKGVLCHTLILIMCMLTEVVFRPCGVSLGHQECIGSESCTGFILLLMELFGEKPPNSLLSGIIIDRGA